MASQQQIKGRIKSVRNTRQITKALELVSASKMRKAQENALKGRDYATLSEQLLTRLRELTDVSQHPLFEIREKVKARLHIVITSDRGMAGAYNSGALKAFAKAVQEDRDNGITSYALTIGRQGSTFASKIEHIQSLGAYTEFPEHPTANDLRPILSTITNAFIAGSRLPKVQKELQAVQNEDDEEQGNDKRERLDGALLASLEEDFTGNLPAVDYVDVIYTDYKSSIVQEVTTTRLLPAAFSEVPIEPDLERAEFEPSADAVMNAVSARLVEARLYQTLLESLASEHSSRMLAMKNASDNASDIIDDLTLEFNTARQAAITQELAEITGGAEAIK